MGFQCPRRRVAAMSKVISHMTMSLDGEITDAEDGVEELFGWYQRLG